MVKEVEAERDNVDMSEQRKQDGKVAESTNPEGKVTGEERGDYDPWMLVGRKKQAPKSQVTCAQPIKSNLKHISALNAKDLRRFRRFAPEISPPNRSPLDLPDGTRKLGRVDNTSLTDATFSHSHKIMASDGACSELPKVTCSPSGLKRFDPIGIHTSPVSNSVRSNLAKPIPKVNNKPKQKLRVAPVSHGEQTSKALGNKPSRKSNDTIFVVHSADSCVFNHDLGVV